MGLFLLKNMVSALRAGFPLNPDTSRPVTYHAMVCANPDAFKRFDVVDSISGTEDENLLHLPRINSNRILLDYLRLHGIHGAICDDVEKENIPIASYNKRLGGFTLEVHSKFVDELVIFANEKCFDYSDYSRYCIAVATDIARQWCAENGHTLIEETPEDSPAQ